MGKLVLALGIGLIPALWCAGGTREDASAKEEKAEAAKKELRKLHGTWVMTAVAWDGQEPAEQDVTSNARRELVIRGNKYTEGQVNGKPSKGFLRLDPHQKPKTMDRSSTPAFRPGETRYEIYELDGDTLKTCFSEKTADKPEERPAEFKTKPKSGRMILYWKRTP